MSVDQRLGIDARAGVYFADERVGGPYEWDEFVMDMANQELNATIDFAGEQCEGGEQLARSLGRELCIPTIVVMDVSSPLMIEGQDRGRSLTHRAAEDTILTAKRLAIVTSEGHGKLLEFINASRKSYRQEQLEQLVIGRTVSVMTIHGEREADIVMPESSVPAYRGKVNATISE